MQKKRVTLEEISKEIGISRITISRVINGTGNVRPGNREIILDALEKYGYKPNRAARHLALNEEYNVGFIGFHSPRSPFFIKNIEAGVDEAERIYRDYGLRVEKRVFSFEEPEAQLAAMEEMLESGVQAFALVPNDARKPEVLEELKLLIAKAAESGIPVVTVNRDIPDSARKLYVGSDYNLSGRMAAELLAKMVQGGRILVTVGLSDTGFYDVGYRLQGFEEKIADYNHVGILPYYYYDGNPESLKRDLPKILSREPEITGLFDITYEVDIVSSVLRQREDHIKVVGFDLSENIKEHMLEHTIDAIIFQDMHAQGYQAISRLYRFLSEPQAEETTKGSTILTKLEVVCESNLGSYI